MQRFLNQLIPLLLMLLAVAAFAFGIILFAYLFLFFALASIIIFCITWLRNKFFRPKIMVQPQKSKPKTGRIIDSDDWKTL